MSQVIIPGDSLREHVGSEDSVILGPGIYKYPKTQEMIPQQAGYLNVVNASKRSQEKLVYVEADSKRYVPQTNDLVLGIVIGVYSENFKVLLQNFSQPVQLSMFAFPNATKKNRPNLRVGQAVYARVSQAVPEVDIEIECIDPDTGKEGGFGPLDDSGLVFELHHNFARDLLFNKSSVFLEKLASRCAFEIAIGINGRVWIKVGGGLAEKASKKPENDGEGNDDMDVDENVVRDVKMTLAAAKYLQACQKCPVSEVDRELRRAFGLAVARATDN